MEVLFVYRSLASLFNTVLPGNACQIAVFLFFLSFAISLCRGGYTYVTVFNCPPEGSHIPSSGCFCMPARSVCFRTPILSLGHPGSFKSAHDLKCMRTQTAPLFNVPRGRRGNTSFSITQIHSCTMPRPGIEPGPLPY